MAASVRTLMGRLGAAGLPQQIMNSSRFTMASSPQRLAPFFSPFWTQQQLFSSRSFSSAAATPEDDLPLEDFSQMTNEQLMETSDIPGWDLVTTKPRRYPRGSLVGTVVSTKMQKTINVAVDRYRLHKKYRKRQRFTRKFMAHDEEEVANEGDLVLIVPCHRMSKRKHFLLSEILRAKGIL